MAFFSTTISPYNMSGKIKPLFDLKNECGIVYTISDALTGVNYNIYKSSNIITSYDSFLFDNEENNEAKLIDFEIVCCNKPLNKETDIGDINIKEIIKNDNMAPSDNSNPALLTIANKKIYEEMSLEVDKMVQIIEKDLINKGFLKKPTLKKNSLNRIKPKAVIVEYISKDVNNGLLKDLNTEESNVNQISDVHNVPLYLDIVVTKYKEGFVINGTNFIQLKSWNGLIVSGQTRYLCVLCNTSLSKSNVDVHLNINITHLKNFQERRHYILAEFGDNLITQVSKQDRYHCPICSNIIKLRKNILKHCESHHHQLKLEISKSKCRKLLEKTKEKKSVIESCEC